MTTLQEVLEKKEAIKALAKTFNYVNTKIYYEDDGDGVFLLHFIVHEGPVETKKHLNSFDRTSYLEAKLIELLHCQIDVTDYDCIKNVYKDDADDKSILIDNNDEAIQKFLKNDITFAQLDKEDRELQDTILKEADEYIKKHSSEFEVQETKESDAGYQSLMLSASHSKNVMAEKEELAKPKKKPRLEFDDSDETVLLRIPISKDFQLTNMSSSENETIAEQLTEHFYKCIGKAPTFVK